MVNEVRIFILLIFIYFIFVLFLDHSGAHTDSDLIELILAVCKASVQTCCAIALSRTFDNLGGGASLAVFRNYLWLCTQELFLLVYG